MGGQRVLVGSYTAESGGRGEGVAVFGLEGADGGLTPVGVVEMASPSWLLRHPALPVVYAANELEEGAVTAFAADGSSVFGAQTSGGAHPCHLAFSGGFVLAANYTGGSVGVLETDAEGRLGDLVDVVRHEGSGPNAERQEGPHPHMVVPGADGLVSVVDLGTDEIRSYQLSDKGALTPVAVSAMPAGSGPRQLVRRPGTDLAYVACELGGVVLTVRETAPGEFEVVDSTSATAAGEDPRQVAHLEVTETGLVVSTRGVDVLTTFVFDNDLPRAVADHPCGPWPRHFALAGETWYAALERGHQILDSAGRRYDTGSPTCVLVL